jgi:ribonuclease HII
MLQKNPQNDKLYASIDEVGRGAIAGPVVAACVIWPPDTEEYDYMIKDSKKCTPTQRKFLDSYIKTRAIDYSISFISNERIDEINILNATMEAMHECLNNLKVKVDHILVDGNYFKKYENIPYTCCIKGDSTYISIAAASIIAKEARDNYMSEIAKDFPKYKWENNKGYGSSDHMSTVIKYGTTPLHRITFLKNI